MLVLTDDAKNDGGPMNKFWALHEFVALSELQDGIQDSTEHRI